MTRAWSRSPISTRGIQNDEQLRRIVTAAGTAILGLDSEGVPFLLRLSSPDVAHCLIAGTTGSGKTELARTIIASLILHQKPRDLQLALFDPKGRGLAPFESAPHLLCPIVADPDHTLAKMRYLVSEMERRDQLLVERPRIVVVVDELTDLLQVCGTELEAVADAARPTRTRARASRSSRARRNRPRARSAA